MGLCNSDLWTNEEIEILKKYYLIEGLKVIDRINGRTKAAIGAQARRLGMKKPQNQLKQKWTDEEIEILKKYYSIEGLNVIDRLDGRTKGAIMEQTRRLNIVRKNQAQTESKEEAARVAKEKAKEYGKAI